MTQILAIAEKLKQIPYSRIWIAADSFGVYPLKSANPILTQKILFPQAGIGVGIAGNLDILEIIKDESLYKPKPNLEEAAIHIGSLLEYKLKDYHNTNGRTHPDWYYGAHALVLGYENENPICYKIDVHISENPITKIKFINLMPPILLAIGIEPTSAEEYVRKFTAEGMSIEKALEMAIKKQIEAKHPFLATPVIVKNIEQPTKK